MQLNKVLKSLALASVMVIAACSSSQNSGSDATDDSLPGTSIDTDANTDINTNSIDVNKERLLTLQLQQLQQNDTVYFALDKYNIDQNFSKILDQHAAFLRDHPDYNVTVEGYTDERGTPEYNIALGERRANAVKMYLQGSGVSASQISIISYGKEKPAVLGHDEAAYAKNRRAIIVY